MTFVKDLEKLLKPENIVIIVGVIIVGVALCHYSDQKNLTLSGFSSISQPPGTPMSQIAPEVRASQQAGAEQTLPVPYPSIEPNEAAPVNLNANTLPNRSAPENCTRQPTLNPSELLPKTSSGDQNSWAALQVPSGGSGGPAMNFLDSSYLAGINTVSGSLRNANLQIRSEPANPTTQVSPWLQSTIEPDLMRAPFEIGCPCPGKQSM